MESSRDVYPAEIGYGRRFQNEIPDPPRGGLVNRAFITWCPPEIQPDTRIIALCGIIDYTEPSIQPNFSEREDSIITSVGKSKTGVGKFGSKIRNLFAGSSSSERLTRERNMSPSQGSVSPVANGWFISDFFMFYHLFKGLGIFTCGSSLASLKLHFRSCTE